MSYASDKLYNGYLRKNMPRIVSMVKPREIIIHLPCLTEHDRDSIEAKNDFSGNFEAMKLLLSCMKRRESWPEQFIAALEECEHWTIAAEIRAEYDQLRGINNSSPPPPAPPAASVVMAHVHPAPAALHLPDPGPTLDVPSETPEPIQETNTPTQSTPEAPVVEVTTPPEPPKVQAEPQAVVVHPATPPPSPQSTRDSTNPSPPPEQVDFICHQEPEENLEPAIVQVQDFPNVTVNIPQEEEEITEVPLAAEPKDEPCEIDDSMEAITLMDQPTPADAAIVEEITPLINIVNKPVVIEPEPITVVMEDPPQSVNTVEEDAFTISIVDNPTAPPVAAAEVQPARSPSPMTNLDDLILTPEKAPVQETSTREEKVPSVVPVLEETPKPQNAEIVEIVQETEVTPSLPAKMENGESDQDSASEEEDLCFSKPGVLVSVEPPDQNNTTMRPPSPDCMPYSGDSGRLEMSEVQKSALAACQENGIGYKQPDKDVSESPAPSLKDEEDVEENVGHVTEEPSILNKEIQTPLIEDSEKPTKTTTTVPLMPLATLMSDPSCSTNAGDLSESPAPSVDVEETAEQTSVLNQENQTSLIEDTEEQTIEVTIPATPSEVGISQSPAPSLDMEDVRVNVGHVAEEPSILNLEVQMPLLQINGEPANEMITDTVTNVEHEGGKISNQEVQTPIIQFNGEPAKEITPILPKPAPATNDNHQPNDPPVDQKLPDLGNHATNRLNTRYILTAAGVGACALLIAWRFKH